MDEFISKDPNIRRSVVVDVLSLLGVDTGSNRKGDGASNVKVEAALAAFGVNSQQGSAMSKSSSSTGKKFLTPKDVEDIGGFVNSIDQLKQAGGADILIPGSLGM